MFSAGQLMAQRYMTRNAEVYFLSDKDAIEVVEATNNQVGAVVDLSSNDIAFQIQICLLYTSPSPRDRQKSRMPSSA